MRLRLVLFLLIGTLLGSGVLAAAVLSNAPRSAGRGGEVVEPARRTAAPPPATATPVTHDHLTEHIAERLADPALPQGPRLAVAVADGAGRPLAEQHPDVPLIPASLQKLVTASAALASLGADHRFRTEVRATGTIREGVVDGDLVLVGGADPALAGPRFEQVNPERPRTPLEDLAAAVRDAGIRHVRGSVVGTGAYLPHEPVAPGWPDRYLERGDTSRSSGLTANGGRRIFASGGVLHSEPAEDPAAEAAAVLTTLLTDAGVTVDGAPASRPQGPAARPVVARIDSPPLGDLLAFMVERSDNHLADTIFRSMGRVHGDGTWASGGRAARRALEPLALPWSRVVLADGSGLSRDNRLSARFVVELDVARHRAAGAQWRGLMAVAGESGTLQRRLRGTIAEGRVYGKTGSLRDARALSAVVTGPDEARYHLAVIGNGLDADEAVAVRRLQDDLVLLLSQDLHGCIEVPVTAAEADAALPERLLAHEVVGTAVHCRASQESSRASPAATNSTPPARQAAA